MITLSNIKQYTLQEIFDFVCDHLKKQDKRAISSIDGNIKYWEESGNKCAIGCLVSESEYCYKNEGKDLCNTTYTEFFDTPDCYSRFAMLYDLQLIHDAMTKCVPAFIPGYHENWSVVDINGGAWEILWKDRLQHLARQFNLEWKFGE